MATGKSRARGDLTIAPIDGDDNFEAQLLAALERIYTRVGEVQDTLTLLLAVLTMDEEETTGSPQ